MSEPMKSEERMIVCNVCTMVIGIAVILLALIFNLNKPGGACTRDPNARVLLRENITREYSDGTTETKERNP